MVETSKMHERLQNLPDIPLPDDLWSRVEAGRQSRRRRRKTAVAIMSLALVAVIATPLLLQGTHPAGGRPTFADQPTIVEQDVQAEVHALDLALQAAYDRGASDAEIAPMWVARDRLMSGLRRVAARTNQT